MNIVVKFWIIAGVGAVIGLGMLYADSRAAQKAYGPRSSVMSARCLS